MSTHTALVEVVAIVRDGLDGALRTLAAKCADDSGAITNAPIDRHQVVGYDLAHLAAQIGEAEVIAERAKHSELDEVLATQYVCDLVDAAAQTAARHGGFERLGDAIERVRPWREPEWWGTAADVLVASGLGDPGLPDDLRMVAEHFRRFADLEIRPHAAAVHSADADVPESIIGGLAEIGAFGLSVPEQYGGSATGGPLDSLAMVIATEELSTASLSLGGSLITRPEIVSRALVAGGTEAQKQRWLPIVASGERMCTVMVTEPDFGSDVAGVRLRADRDGDEWVLSGRKTWATFAGRGELALVLARTNPDLSAKHRGLSVFLIEKPTCAGHEFRLEQPGGGTMEGVAIPTPGYRGMHSFEVAFDGWRVPADAVIGEDGGVGTRVLHADGGVPGWPPTDRRSRSGSIARRSMPRGPTRPSARCSATRSRTTS